MTIDRICLRSIALFIAGFLPPPGLAADWPQFMRNSEHTGDAAEEALQLPLGLATCVRLDDAITTSPAVVNGTVFVVDQMGTAYAIDPIESKILWQSSPDGNRAMGGNTSSVCVARGRVYYGTTAGRLHVLDAKDGRLIKSFDVGWPILGAAVFANDSIYLQSVGAIVHCFDLNGTERWRWDHYKSYQDPKTNKLASGFPGSFHDPHYAGGEVAVAGNRVVVNMGWDLYCLKDQGEKPEMVWCNRAPLGKDPGIAMGPAINGEWVYVGHPGTDQFGGFMRVRLADGGFDPKVDFRSSGYPGSVWAVFATPAVREGTAYVPTHYMGVHAWNFDKHQALWAARTDNTLDQSKFTSCISSPALTRGHCVFGTITGELHVIAVESTGGWPQFRPTPFTFKTPLGRPIGSSPIACGGAVYFGCDDGYLYGLKAGGKLQLPQPRNDLHAVRSRAVPATGSSYGAPVASMDQANTGCVDDPRLKPPLRLRWATRPFDLRVQMSADEDSLYFISEAGTFAALEQATGRIRWRQRLNSPIGGWQQLLLDRGQLFVTRSTSALRARKPEEGGSAFNAFDAKTGQLLWQAEWGSLQGTCRTSPVIVGDVVAGITLEGSPPKPRARAFHAETGAALWSLDLPGNAKLMAGGTCVLDGKMIFSCGQTWGAGLGATVVVEPGTGKVLWETTEHHIHGYGRPAGRDGLIYLGGQSGAPMVCLSVFDGSLKWKVDMVSYSHSPSLGQDFFVTRSYGGHGILRELASGKPIIRNGREALGGCPDHSCSPVLLTTGRISYAVSSSGLYARNVDSGEIIWQSLGFAPRACTTPIAANGRLFFSPNVNNSIYCFEPLGVQRDQP
ncbi:Quinohemoprotein alcohol dehydrogenase ADH-IIG precursor [Anatilimnocola aggregata]|uniref:Quinohemoprotein alcohol dehydrogenase ADH-IIG n=1 Tax=Anatilimnocola aggregata TaxID=2528021 RepID=A0A517YMD3_9BACT|nr:PQQ-binding-like beta-propeller repeat protein [Anatilimnocola aggregata]QDU31387.1 Quinohemoprotein alcohol dehydrogenase ADH-IIG precursor [Anatilimnocola aggregata]